MEGLPRISELLKKWRERHPDSMSQEDVARLAGVSRDVVSRIERDVPSVSPESVKLVAKVIGVTLDQFDFDGLSDRFAQWSRSQRKLGVPETRRLFDLLDKLGWSLDDLWDMLNSKIPKRGSDVLKIAARKNLSRGTKMAGGSNEVEGNDAR